jgi:tRNA threonylcarbamoyladenosine biosynthesis protein TsaB
LRIGLTAAKTLAYVAKTDVVGFDSLEGLACNAPADSLNVHVVADAQRGDVYAADFARAAPGQALCRASDSRIEPLSRWSGRMTTRGLVLGPGLASPSIRAAVSAGMMIADPELDRPRGDRLVELARRLWQDGRRDDFWTLEPNYLRRSAAEDQWAAAGKLAPPPSPNSY